VGLNDVHISHLEDPCATKDRAALIPETAFKLRLCFRCVNADSEGSNSRPPPCERGEKSKLRRGASIT
jgi:hypothetical protein